MPNQWIEHVKKYQAEHNLTYREAMKQAKASYKPLPAAPVKVAVPVKAVKKPTLKKVTKTKKFMSSNYRNKKGNFQTSQK